MELDDDEAREPIDHDPLDTLSQAFCNQLMACLEECARGRNGLFSDVDLLDHATEGPGWPEAARLRELAMALQSVFAQQERSNALCDEFLDLCSMHGESHPGERKLARAFLDRIEHGEVHANVEPERKPW
jgi:hypothetical protein